MNLVPRICRRDVIVLLIVGLIVFELCISALARFNYAASRIRTQSCLRQMGIAFHSYHDSHASHFPGLCDFGPDSPTGRGIVSAFFEILPQIEGNSIYQLYSANSPTTYYGSAGAASRHFHVFVGPGDPNSDEIITANVAVTTQGPAAPFAASFVGTYAGAAFALNGMVFRSGQGLHDIKDGSSNTIMIAQRFQVCRRSDALDDVVYNLWGIGAYGASTPSFALAPPELDSYPSVFPHLEQFVPNAQIPPNGSVAGVIGRRPIDFEAIARQSSAPSGFQVAPNGKAFCDPRIPQTMFRESMIVGLCDASARSVNGTMNYRLFWSVVTPNGNEKLENDW